MDQPYAKDTLMLHSPWKIYDDIIASLPDDLRVTEIIVGKHWNLVSTEENTSIAMRYMEGKLEQADADPLVGRPVKEVASLVKSWNFGAAALGLAAINAVHNSPDRYKALSGTDVPSAAGTNIFTSMREAITGKSVAVIGHFPDLDSIRDICTLSVLERKPWPGDLPDSACEYVLPEQDFVFATATSLINKTLPRLLQLGRRSRFLLVGPSVPLYTPLYTWGVDVLAGVIVTDVNKLRWSVTHGPCRQVFGSGIAMVEIPRERAGVPPKVQD